MKQKPQIKKTVKQFIDLQRPYATLFWIIIALTVVFEICALAERYYFKKLIDDITLFLGGTLTQTAVYHTVFVLSGIFVATLIIGAVAKYFLMHVINHFQAKVITDLKRKFFNHIITLSHNFHTTHKTGSLISKLTRGSRAIEKMMDVVCFNYATLVIRFTAVILTIIFINWKAAVIMAIFSVIYLTYSRYIQRKQYPYATIANETEDIEKAHIGDIFTNIDSVKYFGKEKYMKAKYNELTKKSQETQLKAWSFWSQLDSVQYSILTLGAGVLVAVTTYDLLHGQNTIGDVVFIYSTYAILIAPLYRFAQGMRDFYQGSADFESLYKYDEIKNDIEDKKDAKEMIIKDGTVQFENVTFSYQKRKIFSNFSLHVKKNQKIALVGRSGSGKSTLIKLLYRLYDVQDGKISIDGIDIRTVNQESLRSSLSIVPQECVLFDDTIYNNILFSNPHASREQVMKAIKLAQLDTIIETFPQKENTIVGERGIKLSGGEKQRVSIARAILANKKILVLDEATSSLDSETEHAIQESLKQLMKNRTSIIIAHRLSTIMQADVIIVLDKGKIVQTGTHKELIKKEGLYSTLWNLQKGGYI